MYVCLSLPLYVALAIDLHDLRPDTVAIRGRDLSGAVRGKEEELVGGRGWNCSFVGYFILLLFFSSFSAFGGF